MPTPVDPRGQDNANTYFVDNNNEVEMIRLSIQDATVTTGMGGPLAEQSNPTAFQHVLDVGCGPGGWMIETASLYPHMHLIGIDISWKMIEYAKARAQAQRVMERTTFQVMDARKRLLFPDASFDLVNLRFGGSFILTPDWPAVLKEFRRILRPGGLLRITDGNIPHSNTRAVTELFGLLDEASIKGRHGLLTPEGTRANLQDGLTPLLNTIRYQHIQTHKCILEYMPGTISGENFYQITLYAFQTFRPFLQKAGVITDYYDTLYDHALVEMQQHDFRATWTITTVWATK